MSYFSDGGAPDWRSFEIEQGDSSLGHCECCGTTTRRIYGYVHRDGATVAAYFVGWTKQKPDHGAAFDLIIGKWGEAATKQDRCAVALDFHIKDASPAFMVVDAHGRLKAGSELVSAVLRRLDVIGTPFAPQVFALIDAIYLGDPRLDEIRNWTRS